MTEKRFTISSDSNQNIWDNEKKCYYSSIDSGKLVDVLNELNEKNELLKQQTADDFNQSNCITVQKSKIKELEKENEQLKSENNRLIHKTADIIGENTKKTLYLIDEKLEILEHDLDKSVKAGMPTSSLYGEIELLEELKKELS